MQEAISFAQKYLEDLLSFYGLNVAVQATHDEDIIELNVPSTHMNGFLIGQNGENIRAIQYFVSNALRNANFSTERVVVDVANYKKTHFTRIAEQAEKWVKDVKASGLDKELRPMNSADRRVVHQIAADNGLETESVGFGKDRRVIIRQAKDKTEEE